MKIEDSISRAEIHQIAWRVRDDEADSEEVRELLEYICKLVDQEEPLPPEIQRYMRDSLRRFLEGAANSLDGGFGLKQRRKGRRRADEKERKSMAIEVLRYRLAGGSHRKALEYVGKNFNKVEAVISDAWAGWKQDALNALRLERDLEKYPWSDEEAQRLEEIFEKERRFLKEQGYLAPGK